MANRGDSPKMMSYPFATFFSSERKGKDFQNVKFGVYDGKVTLNFFKGVAGEQGTGVSDFMTINYENACALQHHLNEIIRSRVEAFRNGRPYEELYMAYNITFQDSNGGTRSGGTLTVKTVSSPENPSNTMHLMFSGKEKFDIALGNPYSTNAITHTDAFFKDIDKDDARLYALANLLHNIIRCWPILMQNDKIISTLMQRLPLPRYSDTYRSGSSSDNPGSNNEQDIPF